jgi:cytoskeleton protein RodZ
MSNKNKELSVAAAEPEDNHVQKDAYAEHELPGEKLATRRRELNLTLEQVAQTLKLSTRQIAAIEVNDFAALAGITTVKGFVRSYAKLLGLDPNPLVEMVSHEARADYDPVLRRPLPAASVTAISHASLERSRLGANVMRFVMMVLCLFLLALFAHDMGWLASSPFNLPAAVLKVVAPEPVVVVKKEVVAPTPAVKIAEPVVTQAESPPILKISTREDVWVELVNPEGRKMVARVIKAGSTEKFTITDTPTLVVRNPGVVDVSLNGRTLNVKAATQNNVAKLSLK